jgi:class 3 adenylate cyclase
MKEELIARQVTESLLREEIKNERLITRGRLAIFGVNLVLLAVIAVLIGRGDIPAVPGFSVFGVVSILLFLFVLLVDRLFARGRYHPVMKYVLTTLDLLFITVAIVINKNATGAVTAVVSNDSPPFYALFLINAFSGLRLDMRHTHYCAAATVLIFAGFTMVDFSQMSGYNPVQVVSSVMKGVLLVATAYASGIIGMRARRLVTENLTEQEERNFIASLLGRYLPKPAAQKILSGDVELGGEERTVTILFSDIRDFTGISEKLPPAEVVGLLNRYFEGMVRVVFTHDGTLDKFLGDGFMVIFGAPFTHGDDSQRAVRTALEMRRVLVELNRQRAARNPGATIAMGIGIATGKAVVGTIGSAERMEYTAIGDTVNTASRIMGMGREFGADIVVDEVTYRDVAGIVRAQRLTPTKLKGKNALVNLYRIIDTA